MEIKIRDSGIGMTEESLQKLFQPYQQADKSISKKFGGTGLGLCICKELIQVMNGKIEVKSKIGQGTEFIVSLPMEVSADLTTYIDETEFDRDLADDEFTKFEVVFCKNEKTYGLQSMKRFFLKKHCHVNYRDTKEFLEAEKLIHADLFKTVSLNNTKIPIGHDFQGIYSRLLIHKG